MFSQVPSAFAGALVGGFASFVGSYWLWKKRQDPREQQLAKAIRGELQALLSLLERRDYASDFRRRARLARDKGGIDPVSVPIAEDYFQIFKANLDDIGLLDGDLPAKVAKVYTLGQGLVEDLRQFGDIDWEKYLEKLESAESAKQERLLQRMADALWGWAKGRRSPRPENLRRLAEVLDERGRRLRALAEDLSDPS